MIISISLTYIFISFVTFNDFQNGPSIESDPGRLTIYNATESDSGWYTCIVSNIFDSVHRGAWLQVNPLPVSQSAISSSSSFDLRTFVGAIVGVIVVLVAVAAVAMVIVWKRSKRRPALISFVKSSLYRPVNLAVPEDPEWEISEDQ